MKLVERLKAWWNGPAWTDKAIVFLTLAIVGVGVAQTVIFREQWKEMHAGGADTHDLAVAAKSQADEAKVQADQARIQAEKAGENAQYMKQLAEETLAQARATNRLAVEARRSAEYAGQLARTSAQELETSGETARNDQRAWVGLENVQLSTYKVGQPIKATVHLMNTGKSPALGVTYSGNVKELESGEFPPLASDIAPPALSSIASIGTPIGIIPPQGSYEIQVDTPSLLSDYSKEQIDHHTHVLWVWGTVRYHDIFGEIHQTQYCAATLHLASANDAPNEGMLMNSCPSSHNDMN